MSKLTYLQLTNRVLKRIAEAEISSGVTSATGRGAIIAELINEAQNTIWTKANWYSLYKMRTFQTAVYTASTIAFNDADPDTLTDTASGFGDFQAGQTIVVSGSTSNDGEYLVSTAAAGTLTLQSTDSLTAEAAGDSVTVTAITYPLASDHGRTIDLLDYTNEAIFTESVGRVFDETDPALEDTDDATYFTIQGGYYRFYPIPDSTATIKERYLALPTALSSDTDQSDLPIECENAILQYALWGVQDHLQKYESADRSWKKYEWLMDGAVTANNRIIDRLYAGKRKAKYY